MPHANNENHENHRIPIDNHENHETPEIFMRINKIMKTKEFH